MGQTKAMTADEIRDQVIKEHEQAKAFVWKWLHETGFSTDDMCIDSLEFDDIFALMRLYSNQNTANLEAQNKELREALEKILNLRKRPDNVDFWDYKIKWIKGCGIAEQALKEETTK